MCIQPIQGFMNALGASLDGSMGILAGDLLLVAHRVLTMMWEQILGVQMLPDWGQWGSLQPHGGHIEERCLSQRPSIWGYLAVVAQSCLTMRRDVGSSLHLD